MNVNLQLPGVGESGFISEGGVRYFHFSNHTPTILDVTLSYSASIFVMWFSSSVS